MQAIPQDLSLLITNLLQGEGQLLNGANLTQLTDANGESLPPAFLAELQNSLHELLQDGFTTSGEGSPGFPLANLDEILRQSAVDSGKDLPLDLSALSDLQNAKNKTSSTAPLVQVRPEYEFDKPGFAASKILPDESSQASKTLENLLAQIKMERPVLNEGLTEKAGETKNTIGFVIQDEFKLQSQVKRAVAPATFNMDAKLAVNSQPVELSINPLNQLIDLNQHVALAAKLNNGEQTLIPGSLLEMSAFNQEVDEIFSPLHAVSTSRTSIGTTLIDVKPVQMFINSPLQEPQWQNEFTSRVALLTKDGMQTAEIRLNPPHMGPIGVRVVVSDDQANIIFTAQHSVVRDAIESALPRLREMFNASGLQLADVHVADQQTHDQRQKQGNAFGEHNGQSDAKYGFLSDQNLEEQQAERLHIIDSLSASSLSSIDLYA